MKGEKTVKKWQNSSPNVKNVNINRPFVYSLHPIAILYIWLLPVLFLAEKQRGETDGSDPREEV